MRLARSIAREMAREIGNKSREFYEFVLPPVDMRLDGSRLVVTIDVPGFEKEDIGLSVSGDVLSISAQKPDGPGGEGLLCSQRPRTIDKKVRLPVHVGDDQEVPPARYSAGVLTVEFPVAGGGRDIRIE